MLFRPDLRSSKMTPQQPLEDWMQQQQTTPRPILDLRPRQKYLQQRLKGSAWLNLHSLSRQLYLLPDRDCAMAVLVPRTSGQPMKYENHAAIDADVADQQVRRSLPDDPPVTEECSFTSVATLLHDRGWTSVRLWDDSEELWKAAVRYNLHEGPEVREEELRRRWLFRPSPVIASAIQTVERLLAKHSLNSSMPPAGSQAVQSDRAESRTGGAPEEEVHCEFRCLDAGCGSGRDLAWLATRCNQYSCSRHSDSFQESNSEREGSGIESTEQSASQSHLNERAGSSAPEHSAVGSVRYRCSCRWHVTGIDSRHSIIERAKQLLQHGGVTPSSAQLLHASINKQTGEIQPIEHSSVPKEQNDLAGDGVDGGAAGVMDAGADPSITGKETYDMIVCVRFLERAFFGRIPELLKPGGFVLYSTFVNGPGTQAFGRPKGEDHLLQPGELAHRYFGPDQGFQVIMDETVLSMEGRELSKFVARKMCS